MSVDFDELALVEHDRKIEVVGGRGPANRSEIVGRGVHHQEFEASRSPSRAQQLVLRQQVDVLGAAVRLRQDHDGLVVAQTAQRPLDALVIDEPEIADDLRGAFRGVHRERSRSGHDSEQEQPHR